jgi:hypothetical protein
MKYYLTYLIAEFVLEGRTNPLLPDKEEAFVY